MPKPAPKRQHEMSLSELCHAHVGFRGAEGALWGPSPSRAAVDLLVHVCVAFKPKMPNVRKS